MALAFGSMTIVRGSEARVMACPQCAGNRVAAVHIKDRIPVLRCAGCGLVFAGDIPDDEEIERRYADYYSERNTTISDVTRKRYVELLRSFQTYSTCNRILDVGCGCGFFLAEALQAGWYAYGTEVSRSAAYYAEKVGVAAGRIFVGDVPAAGFELGSFDVVTMFEVIEHLRDPAGVLRVVWHLLRDGGLLYLTTPNYDSLSRYLLGSSWRIILPREHLFYFTAASLGPLLRMSGYEVRSCRTTGLDYHAILSRWVFRREGSSWAAVQEARERIESSGALRMLKRCADNVLSLVRLGDTIKIFAEKRG